MKFCIAFCIAFSLTGCGRWFDRDNHEDEVSPVSPAELDAKRRDYCERSRPTLDAQRYLGTTCDSAGFTSLHELACGDVHPVDLSVFSDADGRLHRTADHTRCWDYSKSDAENGAAGHRAGFSKDHMLMRMVGAWVQRDRVWVEQYLAFGEANGWEICRAANAVDYVSRCIASPSLISLLRAMKDRLAGTVAFAAQQEADALPDGFEAHLRVLFVWLSGKVRGGITDFERDTIKGLAEREDRNALYQAVWSLYSGGNMARTYELLADASHWPTGRLPTNHENHCTDYLYQRDQLDNGAPNDDWLPCPAEALVEHPATDFGAALFIAGGGGS